MIRNEIKDKNREASITELELSYKLKLDEKTIYNYIMEMKEVGFISDITKKKQIDGDMRYNVYHFPEIKGDNFIVLPSLINDTSLTTEEKGVMLFIKANCEKGTNHFHFKSMAELKTKIGVGKNSTVIKDLVSKGYVRIIGNAIIITCDAFPLYLNGKPEDCIYDTIYNYCLYKGIIPPMKNSKSLFLLKTKYIDGKTGLVEDLLNKCKNLPNEISLDYFSKALVNMIPEKKPQPQYFTM
jgi:DNA-binding MarR family transcriptional regulator